MLHLLLGRSGSGKTAALLEAVRAEARGAGRSMLLLVPETASHMTERAAAEALGDRAGELCEVVTFRRLTNRIFAAAGGLALHAPDDGARILLMYGAFERMRRSAKVYTHLPRSCSTIGSFLSFYDECAAGCAAPERLSELSGQCGGTLSDKLRDLSVLFTFYEEGVRASLADPRDALERAAAAAERCGFFRERVVLLDGFEGFTPLERQLLDVILTQSPEVYAAFTGDSLSADEDSVFARPMRTAMRLVRSAEERGHRVRSETCTKRAPRTPSLDYLEEHLEDYGASSFEGDPRGVRLYTAKTAESECRAVAAALRELVRTRELRWRDCAVVTPDLAGYAQTLTATFERMDIPCFLSEKTDLLATPVCALAVSALEAAAGGMETEDVLACLKTGLVPLAHEDIDELENYVLKYRIRSFSPDAPWTGHPDGLACDFDSESTARLERLNVIRSLVRAPLAALRDGIAGVSPAIEKARALYHFLESVGLPELCRTRMEDAEDPAESDLYRQLWEVLCRALDSFADALGERTVDVRTFVSLFRLALEQYSVGVIPPSIDRVHIGSLESLVSRRVKAVFVPGLTDAAYPGASESRGVLSDDEREQLDALGLELSHTPEREEAARRFAFYEAVSRPDLLLWLSCPSGADISESPVLSRIRLLLPGVPQETEPAVLQPADARLSVPQTALEAVLEGRAQGAEAWLAREPFSGRLERARRGAALPRGPVQSEALRRALYGARPRLSATGVDLFFSCRYRYFARSGLRLDERRPADFDAPQVGAFLHFVLEHTAREVRERMNGWRHASRADVIACGRRWSEVYAEEKLHISRAGARMRFLYARVRDSLDRLLGDLCDEFSVCLFEPMDFELSFSAHDALGSVEIPLPGGGAAVLSGKVDRVDGFLHNGTLYFRVVDYKSAARAFSYTEIAAGIGMQLLLYLFVLEERAARYRALHPELPPGTPLSPAGVLYAPIGSPVVTLAQAPEDDPEAAREAAAKRSARSGLFTDDPEILRAMDPSGRGQCIPVRFTSAGALRADAPVAAPEQFQDLRRHVEAMLSSMGTSLASGDNEARPTRDISGRLFCETCRFRSVCRFDPDSEPVHRLSSLGRADFFAQLAGETAEPSAEKEEENHARME